jgi:hypothetical protein
MTTIRTLFAGFLLAASTAARALGMDLGYDDVVPRYPDQITQITSCGAWAYGQDEGFYRITLVSLYAQSFLYVQWMKTDSEGNNLAHHTASVAEMNNDHAEITLEALTCHVAKDGIVLKARADFGHEARTGRVTVFAARTPGRYRFVRSPLIQRR